MENINQLVCLIGGKELSMKLKLFLRLFYAILVVTVYKLFGIDWVIVMSLIVIVADLDSIADSIHKLRDKTCK